MDHTAFTPPVRMSDDLGSRLLQPAETLLAKRDVYLATTAFHRAEAEGVDSDRCAGGRWMAHMLAGDFTAAWRESDAIRTRGAPDPHRLWAGEALRGRRVVLRCLHGFGDAVQFLRYVPQVRALASHLILEVPPAMVDIARYFNGVQDVITWGAAAPAVPPHWDVQIEVMELPYIFRAELKDLPIAERYLSLPEELKGEAGRIMELRAQGASESCGLQVPGIQDGRSHSQHSNLFCEHQAASFGACKVVRHTQSGRCSATCRLCAMPPVSALAC